MKQLMKILQKGKTIFFILFSLLLLNACNNSTTQTKKNEESVINEVIEKSTPAPTAPHEEDLSGNVQIISEVEFLEKITNIDNEKGLQYKGKTPAIVDFYADWCRPCIALNPVMQELALKYKGQIIIYKVNVDKAQKLAASFGIVSIPTLFFFKPNAQPTKIVGAPSKAELEKAIEEVLL